MLQVLSAATRSVTLTDHSCRFRNNTGRIVPTLLKNGHWCLSSEPEVQTLLPTSWNEFGSTFQLKFWDGILTKEHHSPIAKMFPASFNVSFSNNQECYVLKSFFCTKELQPESPSCILGTVKLMLAILQKERWWWGKLKTWMLWNAAMTGRNGNGRIRKSSEFLVSSQH